MKSNPNHWPAWVSYAESKYKHTTMWNESWRIFNNTATPREQNQSCEWAYFNSMTQYRTYCETKCRKRLLNFMCRYDHKKYKNLIINIMKRRWIPALVWWFVPAPMFGTYQNEYESCFTVNDCTKSSSQRSISPHILIAFLFLLGKELIRSPRFKLHHHVVAYFRYMLPFHMYTERVFRKIIMDTCSHRFTVTTILNIGKSICGILLTGYNTQKNKTDTQVNESFCLLGISGQDSLLRLGRQDCKILPRHRNWRGDILPGCLSANDKVILIFARGNYSLEMRRKCIESSGTFGQR